ncbi:MAG: hypothetical protein WC326_03390 [Candidatus Delongbacteria bacterium]
MKPCRLRSERGVYLMELMVSISMMGVMVLGLTTVLIVQARQMARDKILNDLHFYADQVLTEACDSFGTAHEITRNANAGGRAKEDIEFNFLGSFNTGRQVETALSREGDRKVIVQRNGIRPEWIDDFPPPQLDPRINNGKRFRVYVTDFRLRPYQDRQFVNARITNILTEVLLTLEVEDREQEQRISRSFRRIVTVPNKHIQEMRQQNLGGGE